MSATVSRTETTMIQIQGHHVRRIFGTEGEFTVMPDKVAGTAYLKPLTDKPAFNVFVSDENGHTWNLMLAVTNGPADIILIKEVGSDNNVEAKKGFDLPHDNAVKKMLFSLSAESNDEEDSQDVNEIIPLWQEATFVKTKVIKGNSLQGEKYLLTNTSNKPMVIDERELYRKGVVAISVDTPNLPPSETTEVYVISNKTEAE